MTRMQDTDVHAIEQSKLVRDLGKPLGSNIIEDLDGEV